MARPLRIEFPDAIYHVTARGVEKGRIVRDDVDRRRWMNLLGDVTAALGWRVFAFVLMDNHFHLFLQTPEPNLAAGMRDINRVYATFFNRRHRRVGHLFQGRYKAILVEHEGHWLEVSRYVHLNPARAGLVRHPDAWAWSSYPGYSRARDRLGWVDYGPVLSEFSNDERHARQVYRRYVMEGFETGLISPFADAAHGVVVGSERFVSKIVRMLESRPPDKEVPTLAKIRGRPDLGRVKSAVARIFGVAPSHWSAGRRCDDLGRAVAAYVARRACGLKAVDVAAALGYCNSSSVSTACQRVEDEMAKSEFRRQVKGIIGAVLTKTTND